MSVFSKIVCVWCVCGFCLLAVADENADTVSVRFKIYLWPEQASLFNEYNANAQPKVVSDDSDISTLNLSTHESRPLYYRESSSGPAVELKLNEGQLSAWHRYQGSPELKFFRSEPNSDVGNIRDCAVVNLPEGAKNVVLVFFPLSQERYKVLPIDLPKQPLQQGQDIVFNLSKISLICTMGGGEFKIRPGDYVVNTPRTLDAYFQMIVVASEETSGKLHREAMRKFPRLANRNTLFFLFDQPGSRRGIDIVRLTLDADA